MFWEKLADTKITLHRRETGLNNSSPAAFRTVGSCCNSSLNWNCKKIYILYSSNSLIPNWYLLWKKLFKKILQFSSVQLLSHVWLFETPWAAACQASLSNINSRSLPKFMSIWVSDAIQPSHPLSSPSPPAPNPSQHLGLFKWVNSSHEVAKVLEFQLPHQSFQWTPRTDLL